MKLLLAELLNLDGIEVTEYHNFDSEILIDVERMIDSVSQKVLSYS